MVPQIIEKPMNTPLIHLGKEMAKSIPLGLLLNPYQAVSHAHEDFSFTEPCIRTLLLYRSGLPWLAIPSASRPTKPTASERGRP